jgi:hypothetical protein
VRTEARNRTDDADQEARHRADAQYDQNVVGQLVRIGRQARERRECRTGRDHGQEKTDSRAQVGHDLLGKGSPGARGGGGQNPEKNPVAGPAHNEGQGDDGQLEEDRKGCGHVGQRELLKWIQDGSTPAF